MDWAAVGSGLGARERGEVRKEELVGEFLVLEKPVARDTTRNPQG